jgi:succinate dehydrogenase / fumarate reductase flavoprotein subunit
LPYTIGQFLSQEIRTPMIDPNSPEFEQTEKDVENRLNQLMNIKGNQSVESFHRRLGKIMWEYCGMSRNADGLKKARKMIQELREEFYKDVFIPGDAKDYNPELEKAHRVADFFELGELMVVDALDRQESCGGHFREEYQTEEGEALRDDENYAYVSAWEYTGWDEDPKLHKEELVFENVELKTRSYK